MKRELIRIENKLTGDMSKLSGDVSGLRGDVSWIRGDMSGLKGDATGIEGDIDLCNITDEERKETMDISLLIKK